MFNETLEIHEKPFKYFRCGPQHTMISTFIGVFTQMNPSITGQIRFSSKQLYYKLHT